MIHRRRVAQETLGDMSVESSEEEDTLGRGAHEVVRFRREKIRLLMAYCSGLREYLRR